MARPGVWAAGLAVAVLCALLVVVGAARAGSAAAQAPRKIFIAQRGYLDEFLRTDRAAAERLFNNRRTYLIVDEHYSHVPRGWRSQPTLLFKYLRDFKRAVELDQIPPEVKAVIYNHEPQLPQPETPPEPFADEFARIAHSLGLTYIAAPGGCVAPTPDNPAGCAGTFLFAGARSADIVDLQIQRSQGNPDEYVWRLQRAIERVRSVNPTARVVTQTTSNPEFVSPELGIGPTVSSLLRAAPHVDGFWPFILPGSCARPCSQTQSSRNGYMLWRAIDALGLSGARRPAPPAP